jgi:Tol biopolymer transport system component
VKQPVIYIILLLVLFYISNLTAKEDFPVLKGPYLGQQPPGMTPRIFAQGIICTDDHEGSSGFALKGKRFIFQKFIEWECNTYEMSLKNGTWTKPRLVPFWWLLRHNGDFVMAPDDETMLFQVKTETSGALVSNIWIVKLLNGKWGKEKKLPSPINTKYDESFASQTNKGDLYFFSRRPGGAGKFDLYLARSIPGGYSQPVNLGKPFNTEYDEWDPYIAPDESYMIFCSTKPGGFGYDDFYISFKDSNNKWSEPVNLGKSINSPASDNRPYVTNDGKYFFYTSGRRGNRDIYWVDARFLEQFRPKNHQ